jgi:hypothetical protein
MKNMVEADLGQAVQAFALANTPLYLLRKLREDPALQEIGRQFSGEQILVALEEALKQEPKSLLDFAKPYAYLVALSFKADGKPLSEAAKLPNTNKWEWFAYIQAVLTQTLVPTATFHIESKPTPLKPDSLPVRATTPTERQFIQLAKPSE